MIIAQHTTQKTSSHIAGSFLGLTAYNVKVYLPSVPYSMSLFFSWGYLYTSTCKGDDVMFYIYVIAEICCI